MTLKHTPGPWEVSPEYNGTYIRASHGGLVASMESGNQLMRDIDARLISAAPDMFAALQMICDSGVALADPIEAAMLAAISKATGE